MDTSPGITSKPEHGWDLPSVILLFLAVAFSTWRMQSANWTPGLEYVRNIALLGYLLGIAIGYSKFEKRNVRWLAINYMLIVFIWQWINAMEIEADTTTLKTQIAMLFGRLFVDIREFTSANPVNDPLFFIVLLSIPYWFTSLNAGYQLVRHNNIIKALIPIGVLMMLVHISDAVPADRSWLIGLFLLMCLLLIGRRALIQNRLNWRQKRVQVTQENGFDISTVMLISAALLVVTAWAAPAALPYNAYMKDAWREATRSWRKGELWEDAFASAKKTAPPEPERFRDVLQLGTSISQSQDVVFIAYVPSRANSLPRLYWRGRVYDLFANGRWTTSKTNTFRHNPEMGNIIIPDMQSRLELRFSMTVYKPQSTIYAPAQLVWVDQPVNTSQIRISNQGRADVLNVNAYPSLDSGDSYDTRTLVIDPTQQQLRSATQPYPDWVKQRYLQLPPEFSPRIRALALEITAGMDNPYEKALAITDYLRKEIQYRPSIQTPPAGIDPLEYFLFDVKAGFCNYYATSEVLMLRAVGIPARLSVGYAQGEADSQKAFYTVRELHAHAWPEVYFTSLGWVEFEPTGNQAAIERPERVSETSVNIPVLRPTPRGEEENPQTLPEQNQQEQQNTQAGQSPLGFVIISVIVIFIGMAVFITTRRAGKNTESSSLPSRMKNAFERYGWKAPQWISNWAIWAEMSPIERSYQQINRSLRKLGQPQPMEATPADRARRLIKILPRAEKAILVLAQEHQNALYTQSQANLSRARQASWKIVLETLRARIRITILGYN